MTTPFEVRPGSDGGTCRLLVSGEVDLTTGPALTAQIDQQLADPTVTQLVVDLTEVTFLDSSGVNSLIRGHLQAQADGKQFCVRGASDRVRRVFDISGVSDLLGLDSTP
jgi:anti-sigma B factor antagonist